jgi:hypothetical protein
VLTADCTKLCGFLTKGQICDLFFKNTKIPKKGNPHKKEKEKVK